MNQAADLQKLISAAPSVFKSEFFGLQGTHFYSGSTGNIQFLQVGHTDIKTDRLGRKIGFCPALVGETDHQGITLIPGDHLGNDIVFRFHSQ